jgi:hypothetical protein
MRLIDYLRLNPMCFDASTDKVDFDASDYINGATAFDIGEVADQLIKGVTEQPQGVLYDFTPKGLELIKVRSLPGDGGEVRTIDATQYVGIVPPHENCFFEFSVRHDRDHPDRGWSILEVGIHLASMSQEWIAAKHPDHEERGIKFAMSVTVFLHSLVQGRHVVGREIVASMTSDFGGRLITCDVEALLPNGVDRSLPQNQPQSILFAVMLVALMMLNCRMVKRTLTEPEPKSRQQRRYEEQHPNRATPPPVGYYTLEIDLDQPHSTSSSPSKKGGWEQAWHKVRGHLRHYKSGKVVPVRPFSKGNPFKGVVFKDYKLKGGTAA